MQTIKKSIIMENWDKIWADFCHHVNMNFDKEYQNKHRRVKK